MIPPIRTVAPASLPVTLAEAKAHCRVDSDDEDLLISALIDAATSHLDGWSGVLGRCIVSQTWRQDMGAFPVAEISLPFPDVTAVTIAYTDTAGASQTLAGANYHLTADGISAVVRLAEGASWPDTAARPDAVRVTMTAGFSEVPAAIKVAILLHVGHLYENREAVVTGTIVADLPMAHAALIAPFRRIAI